ncbi:hypothetical protein ES707_15958 [subsurface metagenome]
MNPLKILTYAIFTGLRNLNTVQTWRKIFIRSGQQLRLKS